MAVSITVNGVDRSGVIKRTEFECVEHAYLGEVGQGRFTLDDEAGLIAIVGWKPIVVEDSAARIFTGFAHRKDIRRGFFEAAAGREVTVATLDGNDLLRRRIIRGRDGKRRAETITKRTAWLLGELAHVGVYAKGATGASSIMVDRFDYRGQYPLDVLTAMAKAVGWNFYVRWRGGWELVFRNDNISEADTCTLSISNHLEDIDQVTTFPPFDDAELVTEPEHVYSGAYGLTAKGHVYETDPDTAEAFAARDGITEDAGIRLGSTATRDAKTFLRHSATEEQLLPVTIQVPGDKVGLVQAGMRINVRMEHMTPEGWDTGRWARILRLRRSRPSGGDLYNLSMDVSPQEDLEAAVPLTTCVTLPRTPEGTYFPLGNVGPDFGDEVTPRPSDGVAYYYRPGIPEVSYPFEGATGAWHFPEFGCSGCGLPDYFVGTSGTVTVTMKQGSLTMAGGTYTTVATGTAGMNFTIPITVDPTSDEACGTWLGLGDSGGVNSIFFCFIGSGTAVIHTVQGGNSGVGLGYAGVTWTWD
jgi:hypothetical protein